VYSDKSSWATVTNVEGRFEVKVNAFVYLPLVVSHIRYQTMTIPNPFTSLPDTIFVEEKENILDEVIVILVIYLFAEIQKNLQRSLSQYFRSGCFGVYE